jgi:hypothetical protein
MTYTRDGVTYRIVERVKITSGRNFGKTMYLLTAPNGASFSAMAKGALKHNTRLVVADYWR